MSWLRTLLTPATTRTKLALPSIHRALAVALILCLMPSSAAAQSKGVNVNTADAATIASVLSGVGLTKAKAIVSYREQNGRFDTPMDLTKVKGIGPAIVAKNEGKILISEGSAPASDASTDDASTDVPAKKAAPDK